MTGIEARVKRGAATLDQVKPGWAAKIVPDRLAMESCDSCVLGQVYGSYFAGFTLLCQSLNDQRWHSAREHGFTAYNQENLDEFHALADAWRAEIRARTHRKPHSLGAMRKRKALEGEG